MLFDEKMARTLVLMLVPMLTFSMATACDEDNDTGNNDGGDTESNFNPGTETESDMNPDTEKRSGTDDDTDSNDTDSTHLNPGCVGLQIEGEGTADGTDYLSVAIAGKQYFVQANAWGGATQEITAGSGAVFHVDSFENAPGAEAWDVGAYPSVLLGSRYQGYGATKNSGMPIAVNKITSIPTGLSTNRMALPNVVANTAYDVWFTDGEVYSTENPDLAVLLMVWFGSHNVNPITDAGYSCGGDAPTYTTACPTHGTFEYKGVTFHRFVGSHADGSIVMSYLAESPMDQWAFDLADIIADATEQEVISPEMYLQNIQAGFEIIENGAGLSIDCFYADVL